jgi:hypothetical protein
MAAHWKDAGIATEVLDKLLEGRDRRRCSRAEVLVDALKNGWRRVF